MQAVNYSNNEAHCDFEKPLEILILGASLQQQSLALFLNSLYSVTVVDDLNKLGQTVNEHDFSLVIICPEKMGVCARECVERLKTNPFCHYTPILVVLPEKTKQHEFPIIEAGAIDCIFGPVNPIILRSKIKNHLVQAQHTKQLELASSIDGLTGLNNRTQFDSVLLREWFNARRSKTVISALMIDVDLFKQYNDTFGHLQGDECLKSIASVVRNAKRRGSDFAARFGGEEFVMILPFTDGEGAELLAQELIARVRRLNIKSAVSGTQPVTISVGVSSCFPHLLTQNRDNPKLLLELADANLYKAKQSGRNKFC